MAPTNCPHDFGFFWIAEIHIVGGGQRFGPDGGEVAIGFGDGLFAAFHRVGHHIARRDVRGEGQRFIRAMHPHDACIQARCARGIAHHLLVILFIDPLLGRVIGAADQGAQPVERFPL